MNFRSLTTMMTGWVDDLRTRIVGDTKSAIVSQLFQQAFQPAHLFCREELLKLLQPLPTSPTRLRLVTPPTLILKEPKTQQDRYAYSVCVLWEIIGGCRQSHEGPRVIKVIAKDLYALGYEKLAKRLYDLSVSDEKLENIAYRAMIDLCKNGFLPSRLNRDFIDYREDRNDHWEELGSGQKLRPLTQNDFIDLKSHIADAPRHYDDTRISEVRNLRVLKRI